MNKDVYLLKKAEEFYSKERLLELIKSYKECAKEIYAAAIAVIEAFKDVVKGKESGDLYFFCREYADKIYENSSIKTLYLDIQSFEMALAYLIKNDQIKSPSELGYSEDYIEKLLKEKEQAFENLKDTEGGLISNATETKIFEKSWEDFKTVIEGSYDSELKREIAIDSTVLDLNINSYFLYEDSLKSESFLSRFSKSIQNPWEREKSLRARPIIFGEDKSLNEYEDIEIELRKER
jgi:hypothetical protein